MRDDEKRELHKHSYANKSAIMLSTYVGCFYCKRIFLPNKITEFIKEKDGGETAVCPYCNIDSVLPSVVQELNKEILTEMHDFYF